MVNSFIDLYELGMFFHETSLVFSTLILCVFVTLKIIISVIRMFLIVWKKGRKNNYTYLSTYVANCVVRYFTRFQAVYFRKRFFVYHNTANKESHLS